MSLDKSAIQLIQESANIPSLLMQINATKVPVALVPDSFSVKDLEKYMPFRASYRLNFNTALPSDFFDYAQEYDNDNAKCFIDPESMSASLIFDLGNEDQPEHQNHTANLNLKRTEAYRALLSIAGAKLSQKEAGDFIEDWADHLNITSTAGEVMTPAQASKKLRDLTIEAARSINSKVDDFGYQASALDSVEAKNSDALPSFIDFKCIPYQGLGETTFQLRLSILTGGDKPLVSLRVIKLESKKEDMANEFKALVVDGFKDNLLQTFIGTI
ncbi:DUF2303 family protein [Parasphingorhabdus sp.]|uniref:DUF2303 family protein n=1 Tax=Parasphingorhabdus sp. TaxID=2709688 RepID=UPI003A95930D